LLNADFIIEGYVDSRSPHEMAAAPISRGEPLRDEGPFGEHTGYYTLLEPYRRSEPTPR
jgi:4-hydroxy-3-polyprenylbenzoate decarboxylase